jgi:hypothetical protein
VTHYGYLPHVPLAPDGVSDPACGKMRVTISGIDPHDLLTRLVHATPEVVWYACVDMLSPWRTHIPVPGQGIRLAPMPGIGLYT